MEFNDYEKSKISKLSPFMKFIFDTIVGWINMFIKGDCDEEVLADSASKVSCYAKGYVRADNHVTVDEAMRILGLGQNRVKCIKLLKDNGIKNVKFNNLKIGYPRDKVYALKYKLEGGN